MFIMFVVLRMGRLMMRGWFTVLVVLCGFTKNWLGGGTVAPVVISWLG